jgi:hypothetical protein
VSSRLGSFFAAACCTIGLVLFTPPHRLLAGTDAPPPGFVDVTDQFQKLISSDASASDFGLSYPLPRIYQSPVITSYLVTPSSLQRMPAGRAVTGGDMLKAGVLTQGEGIAALYADGRVIGQFRYDKGVVVAVNTNIPEATVVSKTTSPCCLVEIADAGYEVYQLSPDSTDVRPLISQTTLPQVSTDQFVRALHTHFSQTTGTHHLVFSPTSKPARHWALVFLVALVCALLIFAAIVLRKTRTSPSNR